jgi:phosphoesterase RecJ-like protein
MIKEAKQLNELVSTAYKIVVIQPDNPDGDSLGSSLALEQILMELGKDTDLVCGVNMPGYLSYLPGRDRVNAILPNQYDLAVIVDTSAMSLIDTLLSNNPHAYHALSSKPLIIIDHHVSESSIEFATLRINKSGASATAEIIYKLAKQLKWPLNTVAKNALAAAILSDTLGLTTDATTADTVYTIAELVEGGVSLSALEAARRDMMRKSPELVHYKGKLLERIEYYDDDRVALLVIPWPEIEKYSPSYNPSMLALDDMRLTTNTAAAVVLKVYPTGKITAKIRTNYGYPIAAKLAEQFGGGGHEFASGFKLTDSRDLETLKQEIITRTKALLNETV